MLLGIDTCGVKGTIALARWSDDETLSVLGHAELAGKTYSVMLVPRIRELLERQGSGPRDLKAIVVVNGPGSFTGVRIGVSSAKALAEGLSIPVLAVSRLALLAQKSGAGAAALDAGRGEFYFRSQSQETLLTLEEVRERVESGLGVCEENAARVFHESVPVDPPTAADALVFAVPRLLANDFDGVATIEGNYVRRSDAELFAMSCSRAAQSTAVKA